MAPRRIGADANDYYDSTLGEATKLALSTTTVASAKLPEGRYLLDAEIFQWTEDVMDALDVVDESSTGLENLYSAKAQGLADGASMPSALEDQIGSTDFSLIGSLDIRYERARWV